VPEPFFRDGALVGRQFAGDPRLVVAAERDLTAVDGTVFRAGEVKAHLCGRSAQPIVQGLPRTAHLILTDLTARSHGLERRRCPDLRPVVRGRLNGRRHERRHARRLGCHAETDEPVEATVRLLDPKGLYDGRRRPHLF
jgi:hypothetical protein